MTEKWIEFRLGLASYMEPYERFYTKENRSFLSLMIERAASLFLKYNDNELKSFHHLIGNYNDKMYLVIRYEINEAFIPVIDELYEKFSSKMKAGFIGVDDFVFERTTSYVGEEKRYGKDGWKIAKKWLETNSLLFAMGMAGCNQYNECKENIDYDFVSVNKLIHLFHNQMLFDLSHEVDSTAYHFVGRYLIADESLNFNHSKYSFSGIRSDIIKVLKDSILSIKKKIPNRFKYKEKDGKMIPEETIIQEVRKRK